VTFGWDVDVARLEKRNTYGILAGRAYECHLEVL
jgi:hypothetical protein